MHNPVLSCQGQDAGINFQHNTIFYSVFKFKFREFTYKCNITATNNLDFMALIMDNTRSRPAVFCIFELPE